MDIVRAAVGSVMEEIISGIPIDSQNINVLKSPFYCSRVVHIPGEIDHVPTIHSLSKLNHFLIFKNYDFCGGVIQPHYTQSLQRELDLTPVAELPAKLDFILNREFASLCHNFPCWYRNMFGQESPFPNFPWEYANRIYSASKIALDGESIFPSALAQYEMSQGLVHFLASFENSYLFC